MLSTTARRSRGVRAGVFVRFFREDISPSDFLNRLHDVMADYVLCAGGSAGIADLATVSDNVSFLQMVYELVRRASGDEPTNTRASWDGRGKKG